MDVAEATDNAAKYLTKFFPNADRIQLEEVEITDDDKYWNITLSYDDNVAVSSGFISIGPRRFYKVFKVDALDGSIRSMKIRSIK